MGRKKPGPKGLLTNPRPVEMFSFDGTREVLVGTTNPVGPAELDPAERHLRSFFKKHSEQLVAGRRERFDAAVSRIIRLAEAALSDAGIWWSGYEREWTVDNPAFLQKRASRPWGRGGGRRHIGPKPPVKVEHKCLWLDTSAKPSLLKRYDRHSHSWQLVCEVDASIAGSEAKAGKFLVDMTRPTSWLRDTRWPAVKLGLRTYVSRMLRGQMGRAGKSGRPAFLACAILGVLLDITPEKVADLLSNYRRRS
jgi:hypothetical protein